MQVGNLKLQKKKDKQCKYNYIQYEYGTRQIIPFNRAVSPSISTLQHINSAKAVCLDTPLTLSRM